MSKIKQQEVTKPATVNAGVAGVEREPCLYCRERKLEAFLIHRGSQQGQDSTDTKGLRESHAEAS